MSITQEATATDFTNWQNKAREMSMDSLNFAIKDCIEAAKAMQGHNPTKSNKYMDEAFTYSDERTRRQASDQSNTTTKGSN